MAIQTYPMTASYRRHDQTFQTASGFEAKSRKSSSYSSRDIKQLTLNTIVEFGEREQIALVICEIQRALESHLLNLYNASAVEKLRFEDYIFSLVTSPHSAHNEQYCMNYIKASRLREYYASKISSTKTLLAKIMRLAVELEPFPENLPSRKNKSVLCFYHSVGSFCHRKSYCQFAHGHRNQINLRIRRIGGRCYNFFYYGFCLRGINCKFNHERNSPSFED